MNVESPIAEGTSLLPLHWSQPFRSHYFRSRKTIDRLDEFYVLPRLLRLRRNWEQRLIGQHEGLSASARHSGPEDGAFFGLRQWQHGDSPKWIHWRTSARLNELAVQQFERQQRIDLCIVVDAFREDSVNVDGVETAISLAATILTRLIRKPSNRIVLGVAGAGVDAAIASGVTANTKRSLEILADLEACRNPNIGSAIQQATGLTDSIKDVIVISSRSQQVAEQSQKDAIEFDDRITRIWNLRWLNVCDQEIDRFVAEVPT